MNVKEAIEIIKKELEKNNCALLNIDNFKAEDIVRLLSILRFLNVSVDLKQQDNKTYLIVKK